MTLISTILFFYFIKNRIYKNDDSIYSFIATSTVTVVTTEEKVQSNVKLFEYIEIVDGCASDFSGDCVNMRSGPGLEYPVVIKLRSGVILKVAEKIRIDNKDWYKILFSNELAYPERVKGDWYVSSEFVKLFLHEGDVYSDAEVVATTTKSIVVDISEQTIYAYNDGVMFMKELISTGLEFTPTPKGVFSIFKKTPSRFMQGPIKGVSDQVYDLPGVPWNLYFTEDGAVIHGAYWHEHFGKPWSHGCVNLSTENAKKLYEWADIGTKIIVQK